MRNEILKRIRKLEMDYNVKVLFAVESGSRAWGFESTNSDYDVRFIYVHKLDWYITTQERKDSINFVEGDLDFAGWELKKALNLLAKGNTTLLEWLNSPVVYVRQPEFGKDLAVLAEEYFDLKSAIYHYLSMAKNNYNEYIKDNGYVNQKKYLYVIRPLLSCTYIQKHKVMAPTAMDASMDLLKPYKAYQEVVKLLISKKSEDEQATGPANATINDYIEESIYFFEFYVKDLQHKKIDYSKLDKCLYKYILDYTNGSY